MIWKLKVPRSTKKKFVGRYFTIWIQYFAILPNWRQFSKSKITNTKISQKKIVHRFKNRVNIYEDHTDRDTKQRVDRTPSTA